MNGFLYPVSLIYNAAMEIWASDIVHFIVFVGVLFVYYRYKSLPGDMAKSRLFQSFFKEIPASKSSILKAAKSGRQRDFQFLKTCLRHPDDEIALFTSHVLSKMDHPSALKILMSEIEEIDKELSESAATGLAHSSKPGITQPPDLKIENLTGFLEKHLHPKLLELKPEPLQSNLNKS